MARLQQLGIREGHHFLIHAYKGYIDIDVPTKRRTGASRSITARMCKQGRQMQDALEHELELVPQRLHVVAGGRDPRGPAFLFCET